MNGSEKARMYFEGQYNCAQSVLAGCSALTGLSHETALGVAGGFGGGMRVGSVCGALTGGLMALGAIFPYTDSDRPQDKERIQQKALALVDAFRAAHGCIDCAGLVKDDKEAAHRHLCPDLVAWVAEEVASMAVQE